MSLDLKVLKVGDCLMFSGILFQSVGEYCSTSSLLSINQSINQSIDQAIKFIHFIIVINLSNVFIINQSNLFINIIIINIVIIYMGLYPASHLSV